MQKRWAGKSLITIQMLFWAEDEGTGGRGVGCLHY